MRQILTFFLVLALAACTNDKEVPEGVLAEIKMREVIWDLARADEFVNSFVMKDTSRNKAEETNKMYAEVYRLHKTSKEQVSHSIEFYQSRPDLLKPILDSLSRREVIMRQIYNPKADTSSPKIDTAARKLIKQ